MGFDDLLLFRHCRGECVALNGHLTALLSHLVEGVCNFVEILLRDVSVREGMVCVWSSAHLVLLFELCHALLRLAKLIGGQHALVLEL